MCIRSRLIGTKTLEEDQVIRANEALKWIQVIRLSLSKVQTHDQVINEVWRGNPQLCLKTLEEDQGK